MLLIRKMRVSGGSIVITIPSQIVKAYALSAGDYIKIIPTKSEEIIIRKINGNDKKEGFLRIKN